MNVRFNDKNYIINLTKGENNVTLPLMPSGSYNVNISYDGDNNYKKDTNIIRTFNVSYYDIGYVPVNVTGGKGNVTVNVTVPNDFTGNATVIIDNISYPISVVNGTGNAIIHLTPGNYTVSGVNLTNDPKYNDTFVLVNKNVTVGKVDLDDVTVDVTPGVNGTNTTVIVSVPDDFTGNVTVNVNGTPYPAVKGDDGNYTVSVSLSPGNYTVNATLSNDPIYEDKITIIRISLSIKSV